MVINKKIIFFLILLILVAVFITVMSNAQNNTTPLAPGSAEDPLITKSYVDEQVATLVKVELEKMQTQFKADNTAELNKLRQSLRLNNSELITVLVKPGVLLVANAGSEFIVRTGRALIYSPDSNGASNLSAGTDIGRGALVPNNQLILFPKEGRGLQHSPASKGDLVVLTRGGYQLKKQAK